MARRIGLVFWLLFITAVGYLVTQKWGTIEAVETKPQSQIGAANLEQVWFLPGSRMLGWRRDQTQVTVSTWNLNGVPGQRRVVELTAAPEGRATKGKAPDIKAADNKEPFVSVCRDGSRIAWSFGDSLSTEGLFGTPPIAPVTRKLEGAPVTGLAFTRDCNLGVLRGDGRLELWSPGQDSPGAVAEVEAKNPGPLWGSGPYLAVLSRESGEVFVFDSRTPGRLSLSEYNKYGREILAMALSEGGRAVIGIETGAQQMDRLLPGPGTVRLLTYSGDKRLLAAGDFKGLYLISPTDKPVQIVRDASRVRSLAANETHVAFSGESGTTVVEQHTVLRTSRTGRIVPGAWLVLALLGLLEPQITGWVRRLLLRKRKMKAGSEAEKKEEEIEGIPEGLVKACLSQDCVLFLGAAPGQSAGLPSRKKLLEGLLQIAATRGMAHGDALSAIQESLRNGALDSAGSAVQKLFTGSLDLLHNHLRATLLTTAPLAPLFEAIKRIGFPALMTSNLDNMLERAFPQSGGRVYTPKDGEALLPVVQRRDFFLLKLRGTLEEGETIRLGPASRTVEFTRAWHEIWTSRTALIIGMDIEEIEQAILEFSGEVAPKGRHYALVNSTPGLGEKATALLLQHGVQVIPCEGEAGDAALIEFLDRLARSFHHGAATAAAEQ
jgi:hypothetical protein